ncbi:DUF397 domain-containing protein [Spirillospora sp. NPDC127200]
MIAWRKATRSGSDGDHCVEVSTNVADHVLIRDSKDPEGPMVALDRGTLAVFMEAVKRS